MANVSIRRQGGAAIMTIPAEILKALHLEVGSQLEVVVTDGAFTARPQTKTARQRYSLRELLRGARPEAMKQLIDETAWAREGCPVWREL